MKYIERQCPVISNNMNRSLFLYVFIFQFGRHVTFSCAFLSHFLVRPQKILKAERAFFFLHISYVYNHLLNTDRKVTVLHGPSMLPDKAKFVECSIISLAPSFWMEHLVIGQLQKPAKFSAFHWSPS